MGLTDYKKKRNFDESPEPQGGKPDTPRLRFVVQKHDATRLHYDFRLEMEGVLKSWAVPKGPSLDPEIKRLAMMVEDHPYDYRQFEGIIPSGYGAGTVIVWDEGYYEPMDSASDDKKTLDKEARHQLHSGKLKIVLHGKKLKGAFALVKAHGRGDNGWLLMKLDDKHATEKDILAKDKSVLSGKTLEQIEKSPVAVYGSNVEHAETKEEVKELVKPSRKKRTKPISAAAFKKLVKGAPESPFPKQLAPMLATLVDKPFDREGWIGEVKWDGYRAMAFLHDGSAELKSRNDKSFNDKFYPVFEAVSAWGIDAVVDGEIVVVDENGISSFGDLQNWRSEADGELLYFTFDILWLEGHDLTGLPLKRRKEILQQVVPQESIIRVSESFDLPVSAFFDAAKQMGLEGIIAKQGDSTYTPGARSDAWLKIKAHRRQEVVIGGYTRNEGSSKPFSALLVGVYEDGKLTYTGKIGTGFNQKTQREMLRLFAPLEQKKVPFTHEPDINKPSRFRPDPPKAEATWLKPELVCEVSFAEMTKDGVMRHPSFEGMREDKKAKDVIRETEQPVKQVVAEAEATPQPGEESAVHSKMKAAKGKKERRTLLNPKDETQVRSINGHELKFTNLSKVFWPDVNVTKRDLLNYYYQAAEWILPYLKDRPQSMNRHPNGIHGKSFYYKDVTGKAPEWIETYLYHSDADGRDRNYLVATDEASLLYMASLGCIEMNPWSSTIHHEDEPDFCIIDLDPAENTFEQVIEAAQVTKEILDRMGVPSYCKTSGSTGLHIYIPLGAQYSYEHSKEFARVIATLVHQELPEFTSIERAVKDRRGKMYIDFLQNRPHATVSCAYSLRPKPGATVSMPLHWEEVKKGLKMKDFTIFNAIERIRSEGDLFKGVLGKGIDMEAALAQLK